MTTRKSSTGKAGAKKLKVRKQTLKDLDPRGKKKVVGGIRATLDCDLCSSPSARTCGVLCDPGTAMTNCRQITCAGLK
jgi:hypothetical protein